MLASYFSSSIEENQPQMLYAQRCWDSPYYSFMLAQLYGNHNNVWSHEYRFEQRPSSDGLLKPCWEGAVIKIACFTFLSRIPCENTQVFRHMISNYSICRIGIYLFYHMIIFLYCIDIHILIPNVQNSGNRFIYLSLSLSLSHFPIKSSCDWNSCLHKYAMNNL